MSEKPPRAKSQNDYERHARVSRPTPPRGYPLPIDPELTPPPIPVELDADADMEQQLRQLAEGLGQNTAAIGKLWDARKDSGRIDKLDAKLDGLANDLAAMTALLKGFLEPQMKAVHTHLRYLAGRLAKEDGLSEAFYSREWPSALKTIEKLDGHVDALDTSTKLLAQEVGAIKTQLKTQSIATAKQLEVIRAEAAADRARIAALELRNNEQDAGDKRQRKLTRLAIGVISLVGGAAGWLLGKVWK